MAALFGPPGSGKTLVGLELTRRLAAKVDSPQVIITGGMLSSSSPLLCNLAERASDYGQVVGWDDLLEKHGMDEAQYKTDGKYDYPRMILDLSKRLEDSADGKKVIVMLDEIPAMLSTTNWEDMQHLGRKTTVVCIFNPGYTSTPPSLPPSCVETYLEMTYRSSQAISDLHRSLLTAGEYTPLPSHPATEVKGEKPLLLDIGRIGGEAAEAVENIHDKLVAALS